LGNSENTGKFNGFPVFNLIDLIPISQSITPQSAPQTEQNIEISLHKLQIEIYAVLYGDSPNLRNLARIGLKMVNSELLIESISRVRKSQSLNKGFDPLNDVEYQLSELRKKKLNKWLNWNNRI